MANLLLIDKAKMTVTKCDEFEAARIMELDVDQVKWAIGDYCRCDNAQFVVITEEFEDQEL